MNCFYHPNKIAIANCVDCGKALCNDCIRKHAIPICVQCNQTRNNRSIAEHIKPIIISFILFFLGYTFLSKINGDAILCGYMTVAIYYGWRFINRQFPRYILVGSWNSLFMMFFIKLFISALIGFILAPLSLLWDFFKLSQQLIFKLRQ